MAKITIKGIHPALDGEHELDLDRFTNRELREVKRETGLRGIEYEEAIEARDTDAVVALAWVALSRKNIAPPTWDLLWDADVGAIHADFRSEEERARAEEEKELPPTSAATKDELSPGDAAAADDSGGSSGSSGESSSLDSESPEETPPGTGPPPSDTGAESE